MESKLSLGSMACGGIRLHRTASNEDLGLDAENKINYYYKDD